MGKNPFSPINHLVNKDLYHFAFCHSEELGLIDLEIEKLYPSSGNEFIVTLRKCMDPPIRDDKKKKRLLIRRNRENSIT